MLSRSVSSEQAVSLGLATESVPEGQAVAAALNLTEELGAFAPLALGMAKAVLNTCTDVDHETGRRLERMGQSILKTTSDHAEGALAFMEKRAPQWEGR